MPAVNQGGSNSARPRGRRRRISPKPRVIQPSTTQTPLDLVEAKVGAHVVFPSEHERVAVTLWIAATHAQPAWDHATRLNIRSPVKRCGKSLLLDLVSGLSHRVMMTANVSVAALVHAIGEVEDNPPTILVDEADTIFGRGRWADDDTKALRGVLNAGFQRNRPYVRHNPVKRQNEQRQTFAMAALAGIGKLPDTIEDRSVIINLRRRRPDERVESLRVRDLPKLEPIRQELAEWVHDQLSALKVATPELSLEDRAKDVWEPLIAIADQAGGTWPARARASATALTQGAEEEEVELLLLHIYEAFQENGSGKLSSEELIEALFDRQDGPWAAMWGRSVTKSMDDHGIWRNDYRVVESKLAGMLKPFGIGVTKIKTKGRSLKGYREEDFTDTWSRLGIGEGTKGTRGTSQVSGLRKRTVEGTEREPDQTGSLEVPSEVPFHMGLTRGIPSVPSVPSVLPERHLRRVQ